ncbi:MAG: adventurous gliding motility protein CglF [Myxococcales bacterium]|nr:adventurous gliding motility protein CglF [Myxococcales bacterium]
MSRKLFGLLAAGLLIAATGGTVLAQDKGGGDVQYKSKTVYDFDDDTVEGDLVRPDGEFVDTRKGAKHSSLIKIRENFIPEMIKSAEDI